MHSAPSPLLSDSSTPEPWLFKGYQVTSIILNVLVWLLLLVCVALLLVALVWWGAFEALARSFDAGVARAGAAGVNLPAASDLSAAAAAVGGALGLSGSNLALPFEPVCSPFCLNAGSFAGLLRMRSSCVCGGEAIEAARDYSSRAATSGVFALAGAAAMWLASCLLLVLLAGHAVTASFDRRSARWLKEQRAERALEGYSANPKDCVVISGDGGVAHHGYALPAIKVDQRAVQLTSAAV